MAGALGRVLAVARHEARRTFAIQDRATGFAMVAIAGLLVATWPIIQANPPAPDAHVFPVAVTPDSPYHDAVASDGRFRIVAGDEADLLAGRLALVIDAQRVTHDPSQQRSLAALDALSQATRAWLEAQLEGEADEAAAFPVLINILNEPRDLSATPTAAEQAAPTTPAPTPAPPTGPADGTGTDGPVPETPSLLDNATVAARTGLRPGEIDPPFPVRSLLLTFAFLIPMNLVAQFFAGSLLADRTRDRALILLTTPLTGPQILFGRTLPYAGIAVVVVLGAGLAIGAGALGMVAALPMVFVVLLSAMLFGLLSRNLRELTFLMTGATTLVSMFLFLPAMFPALPPIAFLSPVSVVAASMDGTPVGWGPFLYATVPLTLVTVGLAAWSAALYREETLFSNNKLGPKAMEGLRRLARRARNVLAMGAFTVPFGLALELFILAFLIPLGLRAAFPLFIVGVVLVEEGLKLTASRAHLSRDDAHLARWKAGALSGAGFFVGEKLALLVALVGFDLLPLGPSSLALWGIGGGYLLIAPLLLHIGTAIVAALGVGRPKWIGRSAYIGACALHLLYNLAILRWGMP